MANPFKTVIAEQIVGDFLTNLEKTDVDSEVTKKLRKSILEDGKFSEKVLRDALFDSDTDD